MQRLTDKPLHEIVSNDSHRLQSLLPRRSMNAFCLRNLMLAFKQNDIEKVLLHIIH